jgi:hypothetical protein
VTETAPVCKMFHLEELKRMDNVQKKMHGLFYDAVSISDYIALNGRMTDE